MSAATLDLSCLARGCTRRRFPHGYCEQHAPMRDRDALMRFIDAVSPFVRDVLDEPFPWKDTGQVAALEALRD